MLKESLFRALFAFIGAIVLSLISAQSGRAQDGRGGEGDWSSSPTLGAPHDTIALSTAVDESRQPKRSSAHRSPSSASDPAVASLPDPLPLN